MFFKTKFKIIILAVIGVLAGSIIALIARVPLNDREKVNLSIDGKGYVLYTARTVLEQTRGLSMITKLDGADGMIFYFNPPRKVTFWNKKTIIDLDLVWLRNGQVVGRNFLPSEDNDDLITLNSPTEVDQVVELVHR